MIILKINNKQYKKILFLKKKKKIENENNNDENIIYNRSIYIERWKKENKEIPFLLSDEFILIFDTWNEMKEITETNKKENNNISKNQSFMIENK